MLDSSTFEPRSIQAVVFDVGETLVDDTREFNRWASWFGVSPHTMSALVGAAIANGDDHRDVFRRLRAGCDVVLERARRDTYLPGAGIVESDLYSDVQPALSALASNGLRLGAAGNQTAQAMENFRLFGLPLSFAVSSEELGAEKPSPDFFKAVLEIVGREPGAVLYVGDNYVSDVLVPKAVGMRTAFLRRGPYAWLQKGFGESDLILNGLNELLLALRPAR